MGKSEVDRAKDKLITVLQEGSHNLQSPYHLYRMQLIGSCTKNYFVEHRHIL